MRENDREGKHLCSALRTLGPLAGRRRPAAIRQRLDRRLGAPRLSAADLSTDCVAVAGGGLHSLALKSDGSIVAWGYNNCGQCDVAAPNTGYVAVAGGNWHSLGLKAFTPPGSRGDLDCDGDVDYDDMDPFVLALSGQAGYEVAYPGCNWLNGDCNDDGTVDFDDIDPFVAILSWWLIASASRSPARGLRCGRRVYARRDVWALWGGASRRTVPCGRHVYRGSSRRPSPTGADPRQSAL